jgi:hypothetical protein
MIRALVSVALVVLVGLPAACKKVEEPPPNKVNLIPSSSPTSSARRKKPPEPYVDLESMPVEQDYEVEAEKLITPKTLLKKVDELEKEVDAK